jgi:hypothetical protein
MKYKLTLAVMTLLLTIGMMPAALADTLNFTLTQSLLGAHPGNTVTFEATVSAPITNGADIFLNGDSGNLGTLTIDDSDFFANAPFFLTPGQSATFDIFSVAIPVGTPLGTYGGFFEILGGADGGANDVLATANFSVVATPEPSSLMLLGSGLAGLVGVVRRKRSM